LIISIFLLILTLLEPCFYKNFIGYHFQFGLLAVLSSQSKQRDRKENRFIQPRLICVWHVWPK